MDTWSMILTIFSVIVGGLITWFASKYFYIKAGKELREEADELRRLNVLMLRALENAGLAHFHRDDENNITGLQISLVSHITAKTVTSTVHAQSQGDSNGNPA